MKKIKFYTIGLAIVLIGFVACQKEEKLTPTNSSDFQYDVNSESDITSIDYERISDKLDKL